MICFTTWKSSYSIGQYRFIYNSVLRIEYMSISNFQNLSVFFSIHKLGGPVNLPHCNFKFQEFQFGMRFKIYLQFKHMKQMNFTSKHSKGENEKGPTFAPSAIAIDNQRFVQTRLLNETAGKTLNSESKGVKHAPNTTPNCIANWPGEAKSITNIIIASNPFQ